MRALALFALLATPATAWEFSPIPICTLSHTDGSVDFSITYDPSVPEYALIAEFRENIEFAWEVADVFRLDFDGPRPSRLTTDRHSYSSDQKALIAKDRGFANVLDGLEFNRTAILYSGEVVVQVPLADVSEPLRAFRACGTAALS